ncbi:MAG: transcriptional regulator [Deltaproteobacteria bacterium]|nr:MAG: transcriptional regulator [Deltaproteobacteria bacterium]
MGGIKSHCPVETTLQLIGSKWKVLIIRELLTGTKRFGELFRGIAGISQKMLTQQLRQMEKDRLIRRKVYAQVPPKVEYSLTKSGKSLELVLEAMHQWGERYSPDECNP